MADWENLPDGKLTDVNSQTDHDLGVSNSWFITTDDQQSVSYWLGWRDFLIDHVDDDPQYMGSVEDYQAGMADAKNHYEET
jgi:hypothetical protein